MVGGGSGGLEDTISKVGVYSESGGGGRDIVATGQGLGEREAGRRAISSTVPRKATRKGGLSCFVHYRSVFLITPMNRWSSVPEGEVVSQPEPIGITFPSRA